MRFLRWVALAAFLVGHAGVARAQAVLSDPRLSQGKGIQSGAFELHPGVIGEVGYDTNYFQRSGNSGILTNGKQVTDEAPPIGAYRLRLAPYMTFETFGRRKEQKGEEKRSFELSGKIAAAYNHLIAADGKYSDEVSRQSHFAGMADVKADIAPTRPVGMDLGAGFARMVEPSNDPEYFNAFTRDVIRAGAGISFRPGGGTFAWRFGYGLTVNLFEEMQFRGFDNLQHRLETWGTWKFLPRTAIVYRGDVTFVQFLNDPPTLANGQTAKTQVGLNGLITQYFGFLALAGWGATFYDNKPAVSSENFDSFIGQLELSWYPSPQKDLPMGGQPVGLSSGSIGYTRNYITSYLGNYQQRDRGYIGVVYLFAQKFVFATNAGFSHFTRPPAYFPDGSYRDGSAGPDNRVDMMAFLEYRLMPTVGINLTGRYDAALTDRQVQLIQAPPLYDDLRFNRFQILLGGRWFL